MLAIVFGVHYNFFIVLAILDWKYVDLIISIFYKAKCPPPKNRARLKDFARPISIACNLSRSDNVAFHIETSNLIYNANQMTGFSMNVILNRNGLKSITETLTLQSLVRFMHTENVLSAREKLFQFLETK